MSNECELRFSLVLATRNRSVELAKFLVYVNNQSYKNFEVIIVDQSDSLIAEQNKVLVENSKQKVDIKYIHTNLVGLSKARNLGLKYVTGSYVAFPDDDCWYHENVLKQACNIISDNKYPIFISGQYTEPQVINPAFPKLKLNIDCLKKSSIPSSVTIFVCYSFLMDNDICFDDELGAGTEMAIGEETDLLMNIIHHQGMGVYDPSLEIYHLLPAKKIYDYSFLVKVNKSRGYLIAKYRKNKGVKIWLVAGFVKVCFEDIFKWKGFSLARARLSGMLLAFAKFR